MNANIDGNTKVMYALTAVKGVGRRYANIIIKKADIDLNKRAGELSEEEVSVAPVSAFCRDLSFELRLQSRSCGKSTVLTIV